MADHRSTHPRHLFASGLFLLVIGAGEAAAHGGGEAAVRAVLGTLPAALAGMRVQVHETVAPQLVVENRTARALEVLDQRGVAFLRIGRGGVEANVTSVAWHQAFGPEARAPASPAPDAAPRWVRISAEPSYGWFDTRLDESRLGSAPLPRAARGVAYVGSWRIPLRVDGEPVSLSGRFRFEPPLPGGYRARLTSPAEIAPGVRVRLLAGRAPGLLLESSSRERLMVIGAHGEPFLRIGPGGVEANVRSPTWAESGRGGTLAAAAAHASTEPEWRLVSTVPRFSWVEPRALYRHRLPSVAYAGSGTFEILEWRVPVQIGAALVHITGVVTWTTHQTRG